MPKVDDEGNDCYDYALFFFGRGWTCHKRNESVHMGKALFCLQAGMGKFGYLSKLGGCGMAKFEKQASMHCAVLSFSSSFLAAVNTRKGNCRIGT